MTRLSRNPLADRSLDVGRVHDHNIRNGTLKSIEGWELLTKSFIK